jgi:hypothetical protein
VWTTADEKTVLRQALASARAHLLSKLDGVSEADARRPMTPSLTNLIGIVKHVTGVELRICDTFGVPRQPWPPEDDGELWFGGDMWARRHETVEALADSYRAACTAVDGVVEDLDLDTVGEWMGMRTTLRAMLVGQIQETAHHAGHADIVREMIDGATSEPPQHPRYRETLLARMKGEVGPEVWDEFRT